MHEEDILLRSTRGIAYLAIAPCILLSAAVWFTSDSVGIAIAYDAFFAEKSIRLVSENNGAQSLSPFAKFIKDISINVPILYGIFSIALALILGVGAAIIRRFFSNLRKQYTAKKKTQ